MEPTEQLLNVFVDPEIGTDVVDQPVVDGFYVEVGASVCVFYPHELGRLSDFRGPDLDV
ncbi:hypothetical protein [Halorubrum sp. 2020YC2]|uniref:hypothetical protein n=1 Tax=Halorubrum sp. 2020YC2 TaxID=2836432 RepID=UPI00203729A0|nr:hypothetical protein [Halorubrum sp. 2020YC2]